MTLRRGVWCANLLVKITLSDGEIDASYQVIYNFLLETEDTNKVIDIIEVSFQYIDQVIRDKFYVPNDDGLDAIFGASSVIFHLMVFHRTKRLIN